MTTPQNITLQNLQPVDDDKNLLVNTQDAAGSCCGGGACSV